MVAFPPLMVFSIELRGRRAVMLSKETVSKFPMVGVLCIVLLLLSCSINVVCRVIIKLVHCWTPMGWVGPGPACAGLPSKPLSFASYLIVGQVAQFGDWAYSAKQNARHPRSPSDTVVNYS